MYPFHYFIMNINTDCHASFFFGCSFSLPSIESNNRFYVCTHTSRKIKKRSRISRFSTICCYIFHFICALKHAGRQMIAIEFSLLASSFALQHVSCFFKDLEKYSIRLFLKNNFCCLFIFPHTQFFFFFFLTSSLPAWVHNKEHVGAFNTQNAPWI